MRISAKGRYALAAMTELAMRAQGEISVTVLSISQKLGISKIYLEQVFALLKRGALVTSQKGAQGGYLLERGPDKITALEVLEAVELSLFEPAGEAVGEAVPDMDAVLGDLVFAPLDKAVRAALAAVTLEALAQEVQTRQEGLMFYI